MTLFDVVPVRGIVLAAALAIGSVIATPAEHVRVVVTDTETTILDAIEFEAGTSTFAGSARQTLEAVAATLRGNPSIELVEVQSHTSGTGDATANLALSERRAAAVVTYLHALGIAPERVVAGGYGDTQPIERGAPAKNERISFLILKRSPDLADL